MTPRHHIRGPYEDNGADDDAYQLASHECTVADLIALAARRSVSVRHVLSALMRGTRRSRTMGKVASMRMGGRRWLWSLSLNGGPLETDVSLNAKNPQLRVKILDSSHN
jgi:hypothetical protein